MNVYLATVATGGEALVMVVRARNRLKAAWLVGERLRGEDALPREGCDVNVGLVAEGQGEGVADHDFGRDFRIRPHADGVRVEGLALAGR
jgi:hypothetical protein